MTEVKKLLALILVLASTITYAGRTDDSDRAKSPGHIVAGIIVGFVGNKVLDKTVGPAIDVVIDGVKDMVVNHDGPGPKMPGENHGKDNGWGSRR